MARMIQEEPLPSEFDVVVLGTGLPESIVASACARLGLTVLHLDRNDYYGGPWSSFNLEGWEKWVKDVSAMGESEDIPADDEIERVSDLAQNEMTPSVEMAEQQADDVAVSAEDSEFKEVDKQENEETITSSNSLTSSWTEEKVRKEWRRFSLDITPKVLCGRGKMVQLLISSGVSRYAEFKSVDRILTRISGEFRQVPCSRSDVFQTKEVSMIEKRRLMKFLTFCLNFQEETERGEWKAYEDKSFDEFMTSRDLTPLLQHYIRCAIAMVPKNATTEKICLFNIDSENSSVRLLELGSGAMACPDKLNVVHLTAEHKEGTQVFDSVLKDYFELANETPEECSEKPKILWKSLFSYERKQTDWVSLPTNVGVTTWPDQAYDYQSSVEEAKTLFSNFWPDEEFLPEIPEQNETGFPESEPGVNGFIPDSKDQHPQQSQEDGTVENIQAASGDASHEGAVDAGLEQNQQPDSANIEDESQHSDGDKKMVMDTHNVL